LVWLGLRRVCARCCGLAAVTSPRRCGGNAPDIGRRSTRGGGRRAVEAPPGLPARDPTCKEPPGAVAPRSAAWCARGCVLRLRDPNARTYRQHQIVRFLAYRTPELSRSTWNRNQVGGRPKGSVIVPCAPGSRLGSRRRPGGGPEVLIQVPIWSLRPRTRQHSADRQTENTQLSSLEGTTWTSPPSLWSRLLQVRALPPEQTKCC